MSQAAMTGVACGRSSARSRSAGSAWPIDFSNRRGVEPIARDLLRHPLRMARAPAAETLAGIPVEAISASERAVCRRATEGYPASLRHNAADSATQVNLGNFRAARSEGG
jgi:hypothetical protein